MICHQGNVCLGEAIHADAFGNHLPDKFVTAFNMRFLPRSHRLAVEDVGSSDAVISVFKRVRSF